MSCFIAVNAGTGNSVTATCKGSQSFGFVMLFPGAFIASSTQEIYCTSVSDSRGGTWDATAVAHLGPATGTDYRPNTLSCGPTFVRTDGDNLVNGDTVTAHFDHSSDHNIIVVADIGGCKQSLVRTQYDAYANGRANYVPSALYSATGGLTWANSGAPNYDQTDYPQGNKPFECVWYNVTQPGQNTRASIDNYVTDDLSLGISQEAFGIWDDAEIGFQTGFNSPQITVGNYQTYDPSFLYGQGPGSPGAAEPPTYIGHVKHRRK